jgi:hypothetical protein
MAEVARWANREGASYDVIVRVPQRACKDAADAVAKFNANAQPPCTVVVGCVPQRTLCGSPSVRTFHATTGEILAECAAHATA